MLIELYGNEGTIRERTETLKGKLPAGNDDLLLLIDQNLDGSRPEGLQREGTG